MLEHPPAGGPETECDSMNGADQAFTTNAAGMHRRGLFAGGTAALLAGAALAAVAHGNPAIAGADAELLSCYARFMVAQRDIEAWDNDKTGTVTQEAGEEALDRWYAEVVLLAKLRPTTAEGRAAKVQAAYLTMMSLEDFDVSPETALARSALIDHFEGSSAA